MEITSVEHLQELIKNEVPESTTLEYKAAIAITDNKEICKDVSALANNAGGIIVYGLSEESNKPKMIDPITDKRLSRERLDQIISLGIQPVIKFKIHPIEYGGGYVYAVNVEPGETAHMALEQKKYYRRYNFSVQAMEDYEVRDAMNRLKHPKLEPAFSLADRRLTIDLKNTGNVLAKYVRCVVNVPRGYIDGDAFVEDVALDVQGRRLYFTRIVRTNDEFGVVHGGVTMNVASYPLSLKLVNDIELSSMMRVNFYPLFCTIYTDNASVSETKLEIADIRNTMNW
jgi:hypothetical protein